MQKPDAHSIAVAAAFSFALLLASPARHAVAQDGPFTGLVLNCWRDFPVQVNTMNKPFGDRRDGSCPLGHDWSRVAEGFMTGYAEGEFDVPAGLCVDLSFQIGNDGSDGGTILFIVNGQEIGRAVGSGPRPSDRCETVTFRDVDSGAGRMTVRIAFEELVPGRIHHNGAIRLAIMPAADETRSLAIDGAPARGTLLGATLVGDPECDPGRRYLLAAAATADFGRSYPDDSGREFPLDDPQVISRGRFDAAAFATTGVRLPSSPAYVGRTIYFAWLPFEKMPAGGRFFGSASNVVAITILP
jgi:hypothetical protein